MFKNLAGKGAKGIAKLGVNVYLKGVMNVIFCFAGLLGGASALNKAKSHKTQIKPCIAVVSLAGLLGGAWIKLLDIYNDISDYGIKWFLSEVNGDYIIPTVVFGSIIFYTYKLVKVCKNRFDENTNILMAVAEFVIAWALLVVGMVTESLNIVSIIMIVYPVVKYLAIHRLPVVVGFIQENAGDVVDSLSNAVAQGIEAINTNNDTDNDSNNEADTTGSNDTLIEREVVTEEVEVTLAMDLAEELSDSEVDNDESLNISKANSVQNNKQVQNVKKVEAPVTLGVGKTSNGSMLSMFRNLAPKKQAPNRRVRTPKLQESIKDILKDIEY